MAEMRTIAGLLESLEDHELYRAIQLIQCKISQLDYKKDRRDWKYSYMVLREQTKELERRGLNVI